MASSLYPVLHTSLTSLAQSISSRGASHYPTAEGSNALPAISTEQLREAIKDAWEPAWEAFTGSQSSEGAKRGEIVRSVMDLLGRELVVTPVVHGELAEPLDGASEDEQVRFQTGLQARLDLVLTLYEVVYESVPDFPLLEPGAVFIPLLEELVELISVDNWRKLWSYVETRSKRFTKDMPASKGKALPLLRTINAFLRFLPRTPADLVFRGRVHQFASSVISVADKSAINMRGDYNDLKTAWEGEDMKENETMEDGADVKMEEAMKEESKDGVMPADKSKDGVPEPSTPQSNFYSTLWSLQQYFAFPPSLDGPPMGDPPRTPFQDFKTKSDFVLPKVFEQTQKEKELLGTDTEVLGSKRKRAADDGGFFHPRYLTGKRLLEHELADQSFRRQILVQYFILFQFLLNLTPASAAKQAFTGGMPKSFVIDPENEVWVKGKVAAIREELRKMMPDGPRFEDTVLSIITRERYYAQWKNDGCPEGVFEIPPMDNAPVEEAAELWKRRLASPAQWPFRMGTRPLSKLWNRGFRDISQLKNWKRQSTDENLDKELQRIVADEEDDKAMGFAVDPEKEKATKMVNASLILLPDLHNLKVKLNWRALRLARQTELKHFSALSKTRDVHLMIRAKELEATRSFNAGSPVGEGFTPGPEEAGGVEEVGGKVETPGGEAEKEEEGQMGKKGDLVTNGRMEEKMEVDATPAERQAAEETVPAEPEEASAGGDRQVEQMCG